MAKRWGYVHKSVQDFREHSDGDAFPERLKNLTKGEAAHIITRLKHGAQVSGFCAMAWTAMTLSPKKRRYVKKLMDHRKLEIADEKEKQRQAREHVRVGPLPPH